MTLASFELIKLIQQITILQWTPNYIDVLLITQDILSYYNYDKWKSFLQI